MSELDDFLEDVVPRLTAAEEALHNGDVTLRMRMWSRNDPVTLMGAAGMTLSGWVDLENTFNNVASTFSNCQAYRFELIAAGVSGDLAYTIGYEYTTNSRNGGPITSYALRGTQVYRREEGVWKVVHRHGEDIPTDNETDKRRLSGAS